jgi:serine/threonine protein phosphatase PrpC
MKLEINYSRTYLFLACDGLSDYFTVTVERAVKHISDNMNRNNPHSGTFIVSSSASMYLKIAD